MPLELKEFHTKRFALDFQVMRINLVLSLRRFPELQVQKELVLQMDLVLSNWQRS